MIGSTDTGIVAEGQNGTNGQDGTNGTNGTNGVTPHIDSTTGNWFIGETNTGVHAEGPEILATTASGNTVLNRMFCMNRNSKVTAAMTKSPIIRITNPLSYNNTFQQLFCGNGNLTEITILTPGTGLSFANWLNNVSSTGIIKKLSETTFTSGVSGLPSGWTTQVYSS